MIDYKELERITFENINEGHCVSLPLLVKNEEAIVARFFVYSVSRNAGEVGAPFRYFEINLESGGLTEIAPSSVAFGAETSAGSLVETPNYRDEMDLIPERYQRAATAMKSGVETHLIHEYAALVMKLTQPCLHSYCRALAPSLFATRG